MENNEKKTEVKALDNGPFQIKGGFTVVDAKGNEIRATDPAFLCRCGHSKNKPFCDGMHREKGFKS